MRLLLILFTTLCLVPALSHTATAQGISVSPTRLFFTGNPGETVSQTITFSNTSKEVLSFNTRIKDWQRDSLGTKVYFDDRTSATSNSNWLSLSGNALNIKPGEAKKIIVSMNIPANATRLAHSMLFFTQTIPQQTEKETGISIGVKVLVEMGIQIYFTPSGLQMGDLEYLAFEDRGSFIQGNKTTRRLALKIHNTGAINKDAFLRFELTNKDTGEETKIETKTLAMLPDATQWVMLDLPADLKGNYLVVALLDAGSLYDLKVAEKEIIYRP